MGSDDTGHEKRPFRARRAAAQHYFRKSAAKLSAYEAARLAVMLPRPRHYEKLPQSRYLASRANTIVARMGDVQLP